MKVALTSELEEIITSRIASGRSSSIDEVGREAFGALEERDTADQAELDRFRAQMQKSMYSLDREEFVDPEELFAELRERGRLMQKAAA